MLGYSIKPEPQKEPFSYRKIQLLIQNIENTLEILKEELKIEDNTLPSNVVSFEDMVRKIETEFEEPEYEEEE